MRDRDGRGTRPKTPDAPDGDGTEMGERIMEDSKTAAGRGADASGKASEPLTEELLRELLAAPDPGSFADAHDLGHRSLSGYLAALLAEKGLKRASVVRAAGLNETFGYQIFKGQRHPSRDKVIRLAIAMGCSLTETGRMLKASGASDLYCKDRRDAIVIFCIDRGLSLQEVDEQLYRLGERPLDG